MHPLFYRPSNHQKMVTLKFPFPLACSSHPQVFEQCQGTFQKIWDLQEDQTKIAKIKHFSQKHRTYLETTKHVYDRKVEAS